MGTWGVGPFENDTANDWAYELEEAGDLGLIHSTLDAVLASAGELDADAAANGLAACEVLACLLGRGLPTDAYTEKVHAWASAVSVTPDALLLSKAHRAIDRILGPGSELRGLWEEADDADAWRASVEGLRTRLGRA